MTPHKSRWSREDADTAAVATREVDDLAGQVLALDKTKPWWPWGQELADPEQIEAGLISNDLCRSVFAVQHAGQVPSSHSENLLLFT